MGPCWQHSWVWEQLKLASFLSWSNWKQWRLVHVRCSLSSLVVFRSCYINNTLWMMWECAWVTVYASLCREWKWHLGEKRSGNPLTSVKSALICWCTTANLLTSIPESSVTVKEKEVRVADWCDTESRRAFTPALLLFPKHLLYVAFIARYSTSEKNLSVNSVFPLPVVISYTDRFQKCKRIWTHPYWPHSPLLLVMEEYRNISTQRFIAAFLQGWSAELVYVIVSVRRRQRTLTATFSHIFIFLLKALKK